MYAGVEVQLLTCITFALDGGERSASIAGRFAPQEEPVEQEAEWIPESIWTFWRREKPYLSQE
jgi:hypothetical protein